MSPLAIEATVNNPDGFPAPRKIVMGYPLIQVRDDDSERWLRRRRRTDGYYDSLRFMKTFMAVVERCPRTGLHVGCVPGGAHSQVKTLDELQQNMQEVIAMLLEDGEPRKSSLYAPQS